MAGHNGNDEVSSSEEEDSFDNGLALIALEEELSDDSGDDDASVLSYLSDEGYGSGSEGWSEDGSSDDFIFDPNEYDADIQDEVAFERALNRRENGSRISKPRGLFDLIMQQSNPQRYRGPLTEDDIVNARRTAYGDVTVPNRIGERPRRQVDCGRCGEPILLDARNRELGVGIGRKGRRQAPPLGHIRDLSTYEDALDALVEADDFSVDEDEDPVKLRQETKRQGVWDPENLRLEHFDCNARAKKITHHNITERQRQKGIKYVNERLPRWKALARKKGVFKSRKSRKCGPRDTPHGPGPKPPPPGGTGNALTA